jgi:hypothetical protein
MDWANAIALVVAIGGVIAALTALVLQTGKLISIAEGYMSELRTQNKVQAAQVRTLASAIQESTVPTKPQEP